jgi:hypothetical protein
MWSFRNINGIEGDIQWRKYFVIQVKFSSLLTDGKQNYAIGRECAVSDVFFSLG